MTTLSFVRHMKKEKRLAIRITDAEYDELLKLATDDARSISDYVRVLIRKHIEETQPKQ